MPQCIRGVEPPDARLDAEPTQPTFQIVAGIWLVPMENEDVFRVGMGFELPLDDFLRFGR